MADPTGLVHSDEATVPDTHALIIGIGKYPYLIGGQKQIQNSDAVDSAGRRQRMTVQRMYRRPMKPLVCPW